MNRNDVDWHDIFAVLITPFTEDGKIDEAAYRRLLELSIQDGVHGIITCGSTGEFYVMTAAERKDAFRIAAQQVAGRVPVIAGTSAISPEDVVILGHYAAEYGLAGMMILPPYYAMPNEREVMAFFQEVSDRVPLSIMLYNGTRRTGVNLVPRLVAKLAEIERVVAIKDSSKDFLLTCELIHKLGRALRIFTGLESMLLGCLAMGGDGAVAMAPQAMGRIPVDLYEAVVKGDLPRARVLQAKVSRFYDIFNIGNNYSACKEAVNLVGWPGGFPRKPLVALTREEREQVRTILIELGLVNP